MRPAARLVRLGQAFRSKVSFRFDQRTADIRSLLSIVSLCAMMGTAIDVEVAGEDEDQALQAIEQVFENDDLDLPSTVAQIDLDEPGDAPASHG